MVRMLVADDAVKLFRPVVLQRGLARHVGDRHHPAESGFGSILPGRHHPVGPVEGAGHDLERDFCSQCGTPLSFRRIDGPRIEIMTGAFDRPDRVEPTRQYGTEARLGWVVSIANMPSQTTLQNYGPEKLGGVVSHQHPDHD